VKFQLLGSKDINQPDRLNQSESVMSHVFPPRITFSREEAQKAQNFDTNFTDGHEFKATEGNEGNKDGKLRSLCLLLVKTREPLQTRNPRRQTRIKPRISRMNAVFVLANGQFALFIVHDSGGRIGRCRMGRVVSAHAEATLA
jgi:hypothetical protein